jgi:EmrB/QacA subfamily drug resistance transporter
MSRRLASPIAESSAGVPTAAPIPLSARRWTTLAGLALASFLLTLGDTALAVALPSLGRDLGLGLSALEWVVNAYTLALSVFLLAGGRLADLLGGRRVLMLGLGLFMVASLISGLAQSGWLLLAGRTIQGVAGALVLPATLALVATSFKSGGRGIALGIWSGGGAAALALGPLAGALVTERLGWAWIFLLNVPLGALSLIVVRVALPAALARPARGVDLAGLATSATAILAVGFALTEAGSSGWDSPIVLAGLAGGTAALAVFVRVELTQITPLVDLRRFTARAVSGANAVMLLSTAVMCSVLFFVSLYLQTALGYSPLETGATFLPMTVLILVVAPMAGKLTDHLGSRAPATTGMLLIALGLLLLSEFGLGGGLGGLLPSLAVVGLGVGFVTTPVTAAALGGAADHDVGVAAGVLNTSRMVGLTLGIALMGAIVAARWPGGFATAPVSPGGLRDGLALAYRVNAGIALATAGLAAATLPGPKRRRAVRLGEEAAVRAAAPPDQ